MGSEKEQLSWRVVFREQVRAKAQLRIDELYPLNEDGKPSPARLDMLGWYRKWAIELYQDPFGLLGPPPVATQDPQRARFPADESLPVSAIADVNRADRTITVLKVYIRPPKENAS